jgi:histone-lysine N-methyltransferase SETD2
MAYDDLSIMDENLANKDIIIPDNSSRDIMEDYLGVPLHTTVKVLEVKDDNELKF